MKKTASFFTVLILVFGAFGCGPKLPPGIPKLHPCTIRLTMGGQPVAGATVALFPDGEGDNTEGLWGTAGYTDSKGSLTLKTDGLYNGIPAGRYKITVFKVETEEREYLGWGMAQDLPPPKTTVIVDLKYDDSDQTPLVIEVGAGKEKVFNLEVTAAADPVLPPNYGMIKATRGMKKR